jgi:metal-responsive CopG/Arc/MetJ family transcriptional regulator
MRKAISAKQKKRKRGRPATGVRPMIGLRLSDEEIERLDAWAKANDYPDRSSAIRALIERGLE